MAFLLINLEAVEQARYTAGVAGLGLLAHRGTMAQVGSAAKALSMDGVMAFHFA